MRYDSLRYAPLLALLAALSACGRAPDQGPPDVALGESMCAECGMIISDERFATATIVEGDRGPEPLLFDDFNCQIEHERDAEDLDILRRWAHDHASTSWIRAGTAAFVFAPQLRTPMASHVAAFESRQNAEQFAEQHDGEVLTFEQLWKMTSFDEASPTAEAPEADGGAHDMETPNGPSDR